MTEIDNLGGETDGTPGVADVRLDIAYNADGSQVSVSATIGGTADFLDTYSYNAAQWLTSITQQGQDGGNAVGGENVTFNYDAAGDATGESLYQSAGASDLVAQETSVYDEAGRVESMTYANADGSTVYDSFSYTYDSGNQLYSYADAEYSAEDATYSYDAAGELTAAAPTNGDETANLVNSYSGSYDPNGNAAAVDGGSTVTGKGNRLLSDGTWDYTFDLSGNLVSQTGIAGGAAAGQTIDYDYNAMNRLIGIAYYTDDVQTLAIGYTYDMYGQLLSRSVTPYTDGVAGTTSTANYVYGSSGNMTLAFVDGTLTDRYLSGPAVDQILADEQLSTGNTWWIAADDQGTVKDILEFDCGTDTTSVASHLAYSPFGNLDTNPDDSACSTGLDVATVDFLFGYTGTWTDPLTGLQWHDNRWYNPAIQQWMGEDPTDLTFGPNPYEYADNSPTNLTDPSGLDPAGLAPPGGYQSSMDSMLDLNATPGVCPRDNIPALLNPDSALPTIAVCTFTEEDRELSDLLVQEHDAIGARFLANGGHTILDASDPRIIKQEVEADSIRNSLLFKLLAATDLSGGIVTNMLANASDRAALRGGIVGQNVALAGGSADDAAHTALGVAGADLIGLTGLSNAFEGSDAVTGQQLSTGQRWGQGALGATQLAMTALGPLGSSASVADEFVAPEVSGLGSGALDALPPGGFGGTINFAAEGGLGGAIPPGELPAGLPESPVGTGPAGENCPAAAEVAGEPTSAGATIEGHHQLPKQFEQQFNDAGLDVEDYVTPVEQGAHRLLPDGLHTGPLNWNAQWQFFFNTVKNPSADDILDFLSSLRDAFGLD